ncbi:hypothetical protein BSL78_14947, partial [Apostichopus japonicus]
MSLKSRSLIVRDRAELQDMLQCYIFNSVSTFQSCCFINSEKPAEVVKATEEEPKEAGAGASPKPADSVVPPSAQAPATTTEEGPV